MKVILLKDVKNVGKKNEVVDVSEGFAKNKLFPNKEAIAFTKQSSIILDNQMAEQIEHEKETRAKALHTKEQIQSKVFIFKIKSNNGKVFGSVTNKHLVEKLFEDLNVRIEKHAIHEKHIVEIGIHEVEVNIYKDIKAMMKIKIEG